MHLVSSSKLKALFLLPILLILFSFGEGDKEIPKFPLAESSLTASDFDFGDVEGNPVISDAENTFYMDGEVVDPTVEVLCEDDDVFAYSCGIFVNPHTNNFGDLFDCSPKNTIWEVGFRPNTGFIDPDNTTVYEILFYWDYANNPTVFDTETAAWNPIFNSYTATGTNLYDRGGTTCTYTARARLRINFTVCGSVTTNQYQDIIVWDDISNAAMGTHDVNKNTAIPSAGNEVGETVEVCRGDDSAVILDDNSTFNCTGAFETNVANQNDEARWVQWVYGSANTVTTGGIGASDDEKIAIDGVYYDDSEFPVYGEPEYLPAFVTAPNSSTLDVQMPVLNTVVGQAFTVKLRSWNTCNPYDNNVLDADGLNPPQGPATFDIYDAAAKAPVPHIAGPTRIDGGSGSYYASSDPTIAGRVTERLFDIVIAPLPAQLTVINPDICVGAAIPILSAGNVEAGATTINWYDKNPWIDPSAVVLFQNTSVPPPPATPSFDPAAFGATSAAAAVYSYWVTQQTGGVLDCESEPVEITLTVFDTPVVSFFYNIVSVDNCGGVTINVDASATDIKGAPSATYKLIVDQNNFTLPYNNDTGFGPANTWNGIVVSHPNNNNAQTFDIRVEVLTNIGCTDNDDKLDDFTTRLRPSANLTNNNTQFCEGGGNSTDIDVTTNANTKSQIVYDITAAVQLPGAAGDVGGYSNELNTPDPNDGNPYNISQVLTNNTNVPQTVRYTVVTRNISEGAPGCSGVSSFRDVIVNPLPDDLTGFVTIVEPNLCYNDNTDITVNNTEATVNYELMEGAIVIDGPTVGNGGLITLNSGALTASKSYNIRATKNDGTGCQISMGAFNVTVNPNLTIGASIVDNQICEGTNVQVNSAVVLTGSGGPYSYDWSASAGTDPADVKDPPAFNPGVTGAVTYTVVVTDLGFSPTVGACTATDNIGVNITPTLSAGTINGIQSICENDDPGILGQAVAPSGGIGGPYGYQWQSALVTGGPYTDIGGATVFDYDPPALAVTTFYVRQVTSENCVEIGNEIEITVTPTLVPSTDMGSNQVICFGDTPADLSGSDPTGGDGVTYTYQWESSANNVAWFDAVDGFGDDGAPVDVTAATLDFTTQLDLNTTRYFRRKETSISCTEYSNVIQIDVSGGVPPAPVIAGATDVCVGDATETYDVPAPNALDDPNGYEWVIPAPAQKAGTGMSGIFPNESSSIDIDFPLIGSVNITVRSSNGCGPSLPSNIITVDIDPYPLDATVTALATPICSTSGTDIRVALSQANVEYKLQQTAPGLTIDIGGFVVGNGGNLDLPTGNLSNPTNADVIYSYQIVARNNFPANCELILTDKPSITLEPEPVGWNDAITTCSTIPLSYNLQTANIDVLPGNSLASDFSWIVLVDNPNVSGESLIAKTTNTINDDLENLTNGDEDVVYTVTPSNQAGLNCTGADFTVTVTVQPEPVMLPALATKTLCSDELVNITLNTIATSIGADRYSVNTVGIPDPNVIILNQTTPETDEPDDVIELYQYRNRSNVNGTVVLRVTPKSSVANGSCVGDPFDITLTIKPESVGVADTDVTCSNNTTYSYDLQANVDGPGGNILPSTFDWVAADNIDPDVTGETTVLQVNSPFITDNIRNRTNTDQTVVYTVTPTGTASLCTGQDFTVTLTVRPEPVGVDETILACSGVAINYDLQGRINNTVSGGNALASTFSWVGAPNAMVAGITPGPDTSPFLTDNLTNNSGIDQDVIYTVTPQGSILGNCFGDPFDVTVTVSPRINISTQPTAAITKCQGNATFTIDVIANTLSGGAMQYQWQVDEGIGYNNITGADVEYNNENTASLTVFGGVPLGLDGFKYQVIITDVSSGCTITSGESVLTVNPLPTITVQPPLTETACEGDPTFTIDVTANANTGATNYQWQVDVDGAGPGVFADIILDPAYSGENSASLNILGPTPLGFDGNWYQVIITDATTGCNITSTITDLTVNPLPAVNPILDNLNNPLADPTTFCQSTSLVFLQVNDATNPGSTYLWSVDPTYVELLSSATASFIIVRLNTLTVGPGTPITITETTPDGCANAPYSVNVIVNSSPPAPVIAGDADVCEFETGVTYSVANNFGSVYNWTLPAGASPSGPANQSSIVVNFAGVGGNITVTETNTGCISPPAAPFLVTMYSRPTMDPGLDNDVCSDEITNIILASTGAPAATEFRITSVFVTPGLVEDPLNAAKNGNAYPSVSSNFIQNDKFVNKNTGDLAVTYTVEAATDNPPGNLCYGTPPINITLLVHPEPVGLVQATTVCSGNITNVTFTTNASAIAADRYDVAEFSRGANIMGPATTGLLLADDAIKNDIFTNTSGAAENIVFLVTPHSSIADGDCVGDSFNITITVDPEPLFTGNLNTTVCSDDVTAVNLPGTDDSGGVITSYDVTAVVGGGLTGAASIAVGTANVNLIVADVFNNVTNAADIVTYTITPYMGTCAGTDFDIVVTVNPEPVYTGNLDVTVCSDGSTGVVLPGNDDDAGVITSYDVTAVVGGGLTGAASIAVGTANVNLIVADVFNNVTNAADIVTYTITPYMGTCAGTDFDIVVTVNPEPVYTGNLDVTVCSDDATGVVLPANDDDAGVITSYDVSAVVGGGLTGPASTAVGTANVNLIVGDVFNNVTNASDIVTYTITPYMGTCAGTDFDIVVTVNPEPVYTGNLDVTVCSDDATGVVLPANDDDAGVITSYDVTAVVGGGLTGAASTAVGTANVNLIVGDVFNNVTNAADIVTYTITPYMGTCAGTDFDIVVTVNPEPVYTGNLDVTVCSDDATGVVLPANDDDAGVITSYDVSAVILGGLTGAASTGLGTADVNFIAADVFNNITNVAGTITYTITPYMGTCAGTDFDIVVTVNPEPVYTGNLDVAVCSDDATGVMLPITDDDAGVITSYDVSAVVGGGLTGAASAAVGTANVNLIVADVFNNVTNAADIVTYTITPYMGTCAGTDFDIVVTVNPEPVYTGNLDVTVCSDDATGVVLPANDDDAGVITSYDVSAVILGGLTGAASTGLGTADVNFIAADVFNNITNVAGTITYTITPYMGTCAGTDFDIVVTVNPEPVYTGNLDATVCSDDATGVVLPANDDDAGVITSYDVTAVVGGGLTGPASTAVGTANVNLIVADVFNNVTNAADIVTYAITPYMGTCAGTDFDIVVTVNPEPVYTGNLDVTVCSDDATGVVLPANDDDVGVITSYDVSAVVGGGLTGPASTAVGTANVNLIVGDVFNNVTNAADIVTYTITPYMGICAGTDFDIVVTVNPEPVYTGNLDVTVCSDDVTGVTLPGNDDDAGVITSYDVSAVVGGGLTGAASTAVGTANVNLIVGDVFNNVTNAADIVTYTITPYTGTCAGTDFDIVVTVNPEPVYTGNLDATVCSDDATGVVLPANDDDAGVITSYDVTAVVGGGLTGPASTAVGTANVNLIVADVFNNVTNAADIVTYTITPYMGTCAGTDFDIVVTVNPEPVYTGNLDATVCSDDATGVVLPANDDDAGVITSYDVSAVVGGGLTGPASTAVGTANVNLIVADVFNNVTNAADIVTYTITPYMGTCAGTDFDIVVTVNPEPVYTGNLDVTVCSDDATGVVLPANDDDAGVITSYDVTAVVGGGLTGPASTAVGTANVNLIVADVFNNVINAADIVTYTITPYMGTCAGTDFDIVVTVNPEPVYTGNLDVTVCSDDATGVVLPANDDDAGVITSYDVTAVVGGGLTGPASTAVGTANVNLIVADVFNNVTNAADIVTYTITPYMGTCAGTDFDIVVTVNPEPVYTGNLDATVCSDDATGVVLPANDDDAGVITSYDVTAVVGGGLTGPASTAVGTANVNLIVADVFNNVTNAADIVTYAITPYMGTCAGTDFDIVVTVNPEPVYTGNLDVTVCSDDATGVVLPANDDDVGVITSYDVSAVVGGGLTGPASTAVGTANVNLIVGDVFNNVTNAADIVTYTITPYMGTCAGTDFDIVVTVDPEAVGANDANIAYNKCSGNALSYNLQTLNIDGLGNGLLTTFTYTVTSTDGSYVPGTNDRTIKGTAPISDAYTNITGGDVTVQYTITPYGFVTDCQGADFTVDFIIYSEPVGSADAVTACSDVALNYNIQTANIDLGNGVASNFTFTVSSDNGLVNPEPNRTIPSAAAITNTYTNSSATDANITYTITPISQANSCAGTPFDVVFTIQKEPKGADFSDTECGGITLNHDLNTDIINGVLSNFTYTVTSNNGGVIAGSPRVVASAVNITDTYNNATATDAVITYVVIPIDQATNCPGDAFSVVYTIQPGPEGIADLEEECSNVALNYDIQADNISNGGNSVAGKFSYTVVSANAGAVPPEAPRVVASTLPITATYVNTTGSAVDVTYTITPEGFGAGCTGTPFDVIFRINPEPVINPETSTICSNDPLTIAPTLANFAVGDVNLTWEITNISGTVTGVANGDTDGSRPYPHTIENISSAPAIITYTYTATSTILNNCVSTTEDILITVNPEPVGTATTVTAVCSKEAFSINPDAFITNLAGNSFAWTANYGSLTGGVTNGTGIINETLINTTNATIIAEYEVTPTSNAAPGCIGDMFIIEVPVNAQPVLDPALNPSPVCSDVISGITLGVDGSSIAADEYDINGITLDAGLIAGGSNAIVGTGQPANALFNDIYTNTANFAKTVTYKIRPVTAGCKGDEVDLVFTVNPAPAVDPNLDKVLCSGDVSGILLSQQGGSAPVLDYNLVAVTGTAGLTNITVAAPANKVAANYIMNDQFDNPSNDPIIVIYEVVPNSTAAPSCAGPSEFITLTIEPEIIAAPVNAKAIICSNDLTSITLASPSNPSAGVVSFNIFTSVISGTASGFIPALNSLPATYEITDNLVNSGNVDAVVRYEITPVASAAASNAGCTGTPVTVDVTVEPLPQVTPGQFIQVCSDVALNHTITTTNNLAGTKFKWGVPAVTGGITGGTERATASVDPIADTYTNTTGIRQTATYTITPVGPSANDCEGTPMSLIVSIDPTPQGTLTVDQPVVCMNGSALLTFSMSVGVAPFEIVYNDGTNDITVPNTANSHFIALSNLTATTTYTFKSIRDFYGCELASVGDQVTVTVENPIADFSIDVDEACTPLVVTFTNNNVQAGVDYIWNFADGSAEITTTDATVQHEYINNSTVSNISFSPILTAKRTNGTVVCSQMMTDFVTVNAGVSLNVIPSITEGCSPLSVNFDNLSQGVLSSKWFWRIKNNPPSTDENEEQAVFLASYTLSNTTTEAIVYEVVYQGGRNGCEDEVVSEITVYPEVTADFTVAPSTTVSITDPTITVTNESGDNKDSWVTFWEWGDGLSTTNVDPGSHTYAVFGTYELKLTVRNPSGICESIKTEVITVEPVLPIVDFEVDITEGCMPLTVQFTNLSQYVDEDTYLWTFVDETGLTIGTSTAEHPEFTFFQPGIINVTLEGNNPLGIEDVETKLGLIEIYQLPTASFSVRPEVVFLPDQIMFTSNLSRLADDFSWDFDGDGLEDSKEFEPSFKYSDPGVYDITLISFNTDTGCSDTTILEKAVTVVESGSSDVPNGFFPGSGLDNGGPEGSNTSFLPRIKGVRDDGFMMQVFDRWGHLLFESNDKTVGWNGRNFNSGKLMPVGVYVYKLELVYLSGEQTTIVGDINLIR